MGVQGLSTFINNNDDLMEKNYQVHDTNLVIDACNLIGYITTDCQKRRDLFGGDMVLYGHYVGRFFDNLERCNIKPILVFDGAQIADRHKSKTQKKKERAKERFENTRRITESGFGNFVLPPVARDTFRSVAIDKGVKMIQCMYEADAEIARLSREFRGPVLSNDSDFYLVDLPYGLIPIHQLEHKTVRRSAKYQYMQCSIFHQDHLVKFFPNLDKRSLPLLGVLAGNDFIQSRKLDTICSRLPLVKISNGQGLSTKQFKKTNARQQVKIYKIIYFLCNKTLEQAINKLSTEVAKQERPKLKNLLKSHLKVYDVPLMDNFEPELKKLYYVGFRSTHSDLDEPELEKRFQIAFAKLLSWLKKGMEHSTLSYRCLEMAHRNILFLQPHIDDPRLSSAHFCQMRCNTVMMRLLRSSEQDDRPCTIYDRVKYSYGMLKINPLPSLENFGPLDYLFYDLPDLPTRIRGDILLATFHSSTLEFKDRIDKCHRWFDSDHAEEFLIIETLLSYTDQESGKEGFKTWKHFKQAVLFSMVYYFLVKDIDSTLTDQLGVDYIGELVDEVENLGLIHPRHMGKGKLYDIRLVHQITQLQSSMGSYNMLNAFLGDPMIRIRAENWLNSCLIYNVTELFRPKSNSNFKDVAKVLAGLINGRFTIASSVW